MKKLVMFSLIVGLIGWFLPAPGWTAQDQVKPPLEKPLPVRPPVTIDRFGPKDGGATCTTAPTINIPADLDYHDTGTTCGKGHNYDDSPCTTDFDGGEDAIYELNVTTPGMYPITATPENGGSWVGFMVTDNCPDQSGAQCVGNAGGSSSASADVTFPSAGTYFLQIDTWPSPDCSDYSLDITSAIPPPANDDCANATVINSLPFTDTIDTSAATTADDPSTDCGSTNTPTQSHSVWYSYTAAASGYLDIELCGSSYDTVLEVWTGSCGAYTALSPAQCNDDDSTYCSKSRQSALHGVPIMAGTTYLIEAMSYGSGDGGTLQISVAFNTVPVELMQFDLQ